MLTTQDEPTAAPAAAGTNAGVIAEPEPARQHFVRVDQRHGYVAIWLEPNEGDACLGVCIGTGNDVRLALLDAEANLVEVGKQLRQLMRTA